MITFFTCPKPFDGHIGLIQRNAITSWAALNPKVEVILCWNETGTAEMCASQSLLHCADVATSEYGTPLLNDMFDRVNRMASHDTLCYINADIILTSEFVPAVEKVLNWNSRSVIVGARTDLAVTEPMNPRELGWEERIRALAKQSGTPMSASSDYFVFRRHFYRDLPRFAIGRPGYDNWLLWHTRKQGVPLVDATDSVLAIHQLHRRAGEWEKVCASAEARQNRDLAGKWAASYILADASHRLCAGVVKGRMLDAARNRVAVARSVFGPPIKSAIRDVVSFRFGRPA